MYAILKFYVTGNIGMMKLLIENGINMNAVNNDNYSALIKAIFRGSSISKLLNKQMLLIIKTLYFSCPEHKNAAKMLIENGIDPNVGKHNDDSALIYAITERNN